MSFLYCFCIDNFPGIFQTWCISFFTGFSNGFKGYFTIDSLYVYRKVVILLTPFLYKWTFQQSSAVATPPTENVHSPDLYIPMMSIWTYSLWIGAARVIITRDKNHISNAAGTACYAWIIHAAVVWMILVMRKISPPVWRDMLAHTGYTFFYAVAVLVTRAFNAHVLHMPILTWFSTPYLFTCAIIYMVSKRPCHLLLQCHY